MELYEQLLRREAEGRPIAVGLVGCGHMGSGMMHVTHQMRGMETRAVSDIDVQRPLAALRAMGIPGEAVCVTDQRAQAEDALRAGRYVVTQDAVLITQLEGLDAIVEATGLTEVGATVAWNSIMQGKHVIMLNVETDVTVGPLLHRMAQKAGCVYTAAFGDEPGVCKMLYNSAAALGFEVVCLGKGKNNAIDLDATPESCREEALRRGMNPKMLAAFKDGSKTMVELAAMSNATGLVPDVPGMHGARADVDELNRVFVPREDGGVLSRSGCVDYSTGKVAPGVFAVITSADPRIRTDMRFLSMGDGPYYTLYRPYHLCNVETPISVAEAVIYGESAIVSRRLVSEVVTVAKRDLRPGEIIGEIGGPDILGRTYLYEEAAALGAVPLGLATGAKVLQPVAKGELLTQANLAPDADLFVFRLRRLQDAQLALES
jgi:predicted homoserine dehydrogenase-like protein